MAFVTPERTAADVERCDSIAHVGLIAEIEERRNV